MTYLDPSEFELFGVAADVPPHLLTLASSLIDAHCHRPTLAVGEHTERLRVGGSGRARLTFLPVVQIVTARARYAAMRDPLAGALAEDVSRAFGLPGTWTDLSVASLDVCAETGEVMMGAHPLGFRFNEVEATYRAGFDPVPDAVKSACAAIVRNALAIPSLNVRSATLDSMRTEYFADTLLDSSVRVLLAPFIARKVA